MDVMCKEYEALFGWIDVERLIKLMFMCEEGEALFNQIDVETCRCHGN